MKLTSRELRRLIKETVQTSLSESPAFSNTVLQAAASVRFECKKLAELCNKLPDELDDHQRESLPVWVKKSITSMRESLDDLESQLGSHSSGRQ